MATRKDMLVVLALISSLFSLTSASLTCEELPIDKCAFSVASSGAHCVLQSELVTDPNLPGAAVETFKCTTSGMRAKRPAGRVPSAACIKECGLDPMTVGLRPASFLLTSTSSPALNQPLKDKLCTPNCRQFCPDLFQYQEDLLLDQTGTDLSTLCNEISP